MPAELLSRLGTRSWLETLQYLQGPSPPMLTDTFWQAAWQAHLHVLEPFPGHRFDIAVLGGHGQVGAEEAQRLPPDQEKIQEESQPLSIELKLGSCNYETQVLLKMSTIKDYR